MAIYTHIPIHTCRAIHIHKMCSWKTDIHAYIQKQIRIHTYTHTYIQTYHRQTKTDIHIHTYTHTYRDPYIQTKIHIYRHTYTTTYNGIHRENTESKKETHTTT